MFEGKSASVNRGSAGECLRPARGPNADYFPNVLVTTHENQKAWFYDDLLRGKRVLINFMSIAGDGTSSLMHKLAKVQSLLGQRLGRDVFIYSITLDPEHDTPEALLGFAAACGAREGWLFLTGRSSAIQAIRDRLFAHLRDHEPSSVQDCSAAMLRYGNEEVGLWGSIPALTDAEGIVSRLSWVERRVRRLSKPRRRGPLPLDASLHPQRPGHRS
jgi:protein SCO1